MNTSKLILAGPGTGKTTRLIDEITKLINHQPDRSMGIIVCTFTRKAAEELKIRLFQRIDYAILANKPLLIGTIHSVCLDLLQMHKSGKFSDYEIISEDELPSYINSNLAKLGFNRNEYKGGGKLWQLCSDIADIYSIITDQQLHFDSFDYSQHLELESIIANYKLYRRLLDHDKKFDFALVQSQILDTLKQDSDFKALISSQFQNIFVDEYQDTNHLQHELFLELCSPDVSITVVGDDDQSIYGFRGAAVSNLVNFPRDMKSKQRTTDLDYLDKNYRSTKSIVAFNSEFVHKALPNRFHKTLSAARLDDGLFPIIYTFETPEEEAEWIKDTIVGLKSGDLIGTYSDIAILFRSAKFQSKSVRTALQIANIPFKIIGGGDFFVQHFIQEIMSVLDFILDRNENAIDAFFEALGVHSLSLQSYYFDGDIVTKLIDIKDRLSAYGSCIGLVYDIFNATNYLDRNSIEGQNLGHFTELILNYDENVKAFDPFWLRSYLRYLEKNRSVDYQDNSGTDAVNILTIHRAKGLEFSAVFLPYQVEVTGRLGLVDHFRQIAALSNESDEEEKRLFYVGATRAKNFLSISRPLKSSVKSKYFVPSKAFLLAHSLDSYQAENWDLTQLESKDQNLKADFLNIADATQISYNQVRTYQICPRQYMYTHIWKLQTVRTGGMQFGANIHKLLQIINSQLQQNPLANIDIESLVQQHWNNNWFQNIATNNAFKHSGISQLKNWLQFATTNLRTQTYSQIEENFDISIENVLINGRFDLVLNNGAINTIVDFKTGDKEDYSDQLTFYGFCFQKKYSTNIPKLSVFFLKTAEWVEISPVRSDTVLKKIETVTDGISKKTFAPTPGKHCQDCAFNTICEFATKS